MKEEGRKKMTSASCPFFSHHRRGLLERLFFPLSLTSQRVEDDNSITEIPERLALLTFRGGGGRGEVKGQEVGDHLPTRHRLNDHVQEQTSSSAQLEMHAKVGGFPPRLEEKKALA